MEYALETDSLGRRYGRHWALRGCSFAIPPGRVAALVGPNGAGKTTLLHLCVGLLTPTAGTVRVLGRPLERNAAGELPIIGFLAQDHPLYKGFTVEETLTLGRKLNPRWDDASARARLAGLNIPLESRVGTLSGGQQAQVALTLALDKRPELLLLDEPLASLDPLARRSFLRTLTGAASASGMTVVLSSHIIGDLERICDYLIVLSSSRVLLAGDTRDILAAHRQMSVPSSQVPAVGRVATVVDESEHDGLSSLLVRVEAPLEAHSWASEEATLEAVVLAYLGQGEAVSRDALRVGAPALAGELEGTR